MWTNPGTIRIGEMHNRSDSPCSLIAHGKAHNAALAACARKLLIYANTVVARGTPWMDRPTAAYVSSRTTTTLFSNATRATLRSFQENRRYWSVRVGLRHRALAVEVDNGYLWFWIGSHADYDKLVK